MSARITQLRLDAFELLPKHARRCVFWEVDPSTLQGPESRPDNLADPEFEKEAWLSMVMLEWGSCGQMAVECGPDGDASALDDAPVLGYAYYAPPRAVPRARLFPTSPVSADAVLLTSIGFESAAASETTSRSLMAGVIADLVRRGVRSLEAFGRTQEASELAADPRLVPPELQPTVAVLGDCSIDQCIIDADYLADVGFKVVEPHRYFPRLRLELEQGLGWKAEVEAALERLLEIEELRHPVGAGASPCS